MTNIEKQIQKARPSLKLVSPLSYLIVATMAVFNIILGLSFLLLIDQSRFSAPLLIVNEIFTFNFWGVVFIAIGMLKLYSLVHNDWNLARKSLILGVSVKAAWTVALIIRMLVSPGTFFLTLCWVTIGIIQMSCYIFFLPPAMGQLKKPGGEIDE